VAPTAAGEELLRSLKPALTDIRTALGKISGERDKPAGRVRLVVSPLAAKSVLGPKLGAFAHADPDVMLDITTDESRVDLVLGGTTPASTTASSSSRTWCLSLGSSSIIRVAGSSRQRCLR